MKLMSAMLCAAFIVTPFATHAQSMPAMDHSSMPDMAPGSIKGMDHSSMPEMSSGSMQGMDHSAMPGMKPGSASAPAAASTTSAGSGGALPAGSAPPPPVPADYYADHIYDKSQMERARAAMMNEQGGQQFYQVMLNLNEIQLYRGQAGYRWDGQAWFGGDINRLTLKSEGGGGFREGFDNAEVQALYSRAIDPYFNLQGGVRQDLASRLYQTYGAFGFEGLAPYWFEVSGTMFVSTRGNVLGRLEGYYDQNITQRLILQPRVELNFAAQNNYEDETGAGLTNAELGLRLRYEITREIAPYIGVSYDTKVGQTAAFASQDGKATSNLSFVAGVRLWF
ncbi:MAG: copper resistance protein B [Proteobacteria bacterium]|nr:copper resistance protein B [Pseudomonadota bacterium]